MFCFSTLLYLCNAYSIYGGPGTDTVIHDGADAFEILGTVPKPTNVKHIKEMKLTSREIPDDSYPYPGKSADLNYKTELCTESEEIISRFTTLSKTEENQYYHPAGLKQYGGNETAVANADRIKARVVMNNYYSHFHISPLFAPPGELITIEVSDDVMYSTSLILNGNSRNFECSEIGSQQRINEIRFEFTLSNKVNKIVWPYGAQLSFGWGRKDGVNLDVYPKWDHPMELIVTGAILSPMFVYGVDSDLDFEKQIQERGGPVLSFDTGNVIGQGASWSIKQYNNIRASDCMRLLRTRWQIAQETARDLGKYENDQKGRCRHPNLWYFDQFMKAGASAFASVGNNYCQFSPSSIGPQFNYDSLIRGSWGVNHEQNHHHQESWGFGYTTEVTNNAINLVTYALSADSWARIDKGNGDIGHGGSSGEDHTHNYFDLWGENDDYLAFWNNLIHHFGIKKFQDLVQSDQQNTLFNKNTYGSYGAELLRSSKIFGYNMIHHFNFHNHSNESITNNGAKNNIFPELEKMNLPFFHPITNFYTNGFVINGEEFITVNPFAIPANRKYLFDFNRGLKTREDYVFDSKKAYKQGGKDLWGHFEFVRHEGRTGGWKEISKGSYEYIPLADIASIDKFYLIYLDTTTNKEYKLVGTIRQQLKFTDVIRYEDVLDDAGMKFEDVSKAYEAGIKKEPTTSFFHSEFSTGSYNSKTLTYLAIAKGALKVPENSVYTFYLKDDDKGMFYLSDKELKIDPNQDKDYLLISSNEGIGNYDENYKSTEQIMVKDKIYHFAIICYNTGGAGYTQVGVKYGSKTSPSDISGDWITSKTEISSEIIQKLVFVPEWHEIPDLNKWKGIKSLDVDSSNFKVIAAPPEQNSHDPSVIFDKRTTIDYTYIARWTSNPESFPHIYDFDFQKEISFNYINYISYQTSPNTMNGDIEIYLSSSNETLGNPENKIYSGNYKTMNPEILLEKAKKGRFFRIKVLNNDLLWSGSKTSSSISYLSFGTKFSENYQYVIPSTNTKIYIKGESIDSRASIGFNGKTKIIKKNSEMICIFPKGTKEFMVIGDKYQQMGSASFYIDDIKIGEVDKDFNNIDIKNLKFATRSYRSILFQSGKLEENKKHVLKMAVTEGDITIAGFVSNVEYLDEYIPPPTSSISTPSISTPSISTPSISTPSISTPSISTPSISTPSISTPSISTPSISTPSISTPIDSGSNTAPIVVSTYKDGTGGDSSSGNSKSGGESGSIPIIIGAVVGVVVVVAIIIAVIVYFKKFRTSAKSANTMEEAETNFGIESQVVDPHNLNI